VSADLSLRLARRMGLVATARHVTLDDPGWPRMWFRPVTLGVRLQ
jgi:hypothetical protein